MAATSTQSRCIFAADPDACPDDCCHNGDWTICGIWIGDLFTDDDYDDDPRDGIADRPDGGAQEGGQGDG